jgi:hypothetical protein
MGKMVLSPVMRCPLVEEDSCLDTAIVCFRFRLSFDNMQIDILTLVYRLSPPCGDRRIGIVPTQLMRVVKDH